MFITFGATYEDAVTGFRGIATSYSVSMTGARRVELTPPATLDGQARAAAWFDFERLLYEPDEPVVQLEKAPVSIAGGIAACAAM
jgi:hypothetical protein